MVNWITASAYTPADSGLFILAAALEQEKIRARARTELAQLFQYKHMPVTQAELDRARTNLASDFVYRRETVQGQARQLGYFLTVFSDPDYEQRYLTGLAAVTPQDIQRVARQYLSPTSLNASSWARRRVPVSRPPRTLPNYATRLDRPVSKAGTPAETNGANGSAVTVVRLDNGVRLLVKEHHGVPVMAVQAATLGGLLFEDEPNAGISNFIAGMLTRGSQQFSRLSLAQAVESLAGGLNGFSGRNSLGLSGSFLTTHVDEGIDIFLETLLHPTFPADEVEKRRREILLALKNREDDLAQIAFDLFYQTLYETHPYRLLTLGSQASVSAMTQAHIAAYYTTLLDPERLVLSVVGDVETTPLIDRLRAELSSLPAVTPPSAPRAGGSPERGADRHQKGGETASPRGLGLSRRHP